MLLGLSLWINDSRTLQLNKIIPIYAIHYKVSLLQISLSHFIYHKCGVDEYRNTLFTELDIGHFCQGLLFFLLFFLLFILLFIFRFIFLLFFFLCIFRLFLGFLFLFFISFLDSIFLICICCFRIDSMRKLFIWLVLAQHIFKICHDCHNFLSSRNNHRSNCISNFKLRNNLMVFSERIGIFFISNQFSMDILFKIWDQFTGHQGFSSFHCCVPSNSIFFIFSLFSRSTITTFAFHPCLKFVNAE